jgi:hypothetical protein
VGDAGHDAGTGDEEDPMTKRRGGRKKTASIHDLSARQASAVRGGHSAVRAIDTLGKALSSMASKQ